MRVGVLAQAPVGWSSAARGAGAGCRPGAGGRLGVGPRALTHSAAPLLAAGQAAAMLADNPRRFADTVKQTFQGRTMQAPPRGIDGSMGRERERPRTRPRTAGPGRLSSGAHIFPSRAPAAHTHARANLCPHTAPPTLPRLSCDGWPISLPSSPAASSDRVCPRLECRVPWRARGRYERAHPALWQVAGQRFTFPKFE